MNDAPEPVECSAPLSGETETSLFVYGSLRRGERHHAQLEGANFLRYARTSAGYELRDFGEFPALVRRGHGSVAGELYGLSAALQAAIDTFEDHPHFYRREVIRLSDGSAAQAYVVELARAKDRPIAPDDWSMRQRPDSTPVPERHGFVHDIALRNPRMVTEVGADQRAMQPMAALLDEHTKLIGNLPSVLDRLALLSQHIKGCLSAGGTVWWMGNGGSAALSVHLAAEFIGRFERERSALASVALCADLAALTAIANDFGYEHVFARQVDALCRPGDVLIGMSTSGRSPNVLEGFKTGRGKGVYCAAFAGKDTSMLELVCDLCLSVPSRNSARVQEAHLLLGHLLCAAIEGSAEMPSQ